MTTRRSSNQSNGPLALHRSTLPLHRSTPTSRCIRSGETGNHLWVERFDKPLAGLFDMQDEIVVATPLSAPSAPPVALLTALFDLTPTEGRIAGGVDSEAKCNPVDSIGSSTKSRVSHSERRPSA